MELAVAPHAEKLEAPDLSFILLNDEGVKGLVQGFFALGLAGLPLCGRFGSIREGRSRTRSLDEVALRSEVRKSEGAEQPQQPVLKR